MKKVLTYGTFDLLHYGHLKLLKRCKALGDHLTVGLSSDEFNRLKGKESAMNFEERKELLQNFKFVDAVIKEDSWDQKIKDIQEHNIDVFVIGDDWTGKFDHLREYCDVIYLPRTKSISTTEIKKLLAENKDNSNDLNLQKM